MKYEIELPDEWSKESEMAVIRDRPNNGRGGRTILRAVESVGEATSSLSNKFYIIREPPTTSPEIVGTAETKNEAKKELIDAARDHF